MLFIGIQNAYVVICLWVALVITIQSNLSKLLVSWPRPLRGGQELFIDIVCLFVYSLLSCLLFVCLILFSPVCIYCIFVMLCPNIYSRK